MCLEKNKRTEGQGKIDIQELHTYLCICCLPQPMSTWLVSWLFVAYKTNCTNNQAVEFLQVMTLCSICTHLTSGNCKVSRLTRKWICYS